MTKNKYHNSLFLISFLVKNPKKVHGQIDSPIEPINIDAIPQTVTVDLHRDLNHEIIHEVIITIIIQEVVEITEVPVEVVEDRSVRKMKWILMMLWSMISANLT